MLLALLSSSLDLCLPLQPPCLLLGFVLYSVRLELLGDLHILVPRSLHLALNGLVPLCLLVVRPPLDDDAEHLPASLGVALSPLLHTVDALVLSPQSLLHTLQALLSQVVCLLQASVQLEALLTE